MCGIAGLYCLDPRCDQQDHEAVVVTLRDSQIHRGPDDEGVVDLGRACLGTRRLSIIDLSPAGHMPMSDEKGRWWITYNGEVYNFRQLRDELEALGHRFRSRTDTEVVLHSYIEWGMECLHKFIGMFAFAIYDRDAERLVLMRDRYGIKPLYIAQHDGHLLFSSEIKAITEVVPPKVEEQRLLEWFLYRNVDAFSPKTLFEGVSAVMPGQVVEIDGHGVRSTNVYRVTSQISEDEFRRFDAMSSDEIVRHVDTILREAVRLRLVSDVPVGTLLSGGLDSSLITAIAAQGRHDLTTFNVSVAGRAELDERRFAEELSGKLHLNFVSVDLTGEVFRRELARAVYYSDLPLSHPNSVAYLVISRVARSHGVVVLLSGEGADELFGGYSWRYRKARRLLRLAPLLDRLPPRAWDLLTLLTYAEAGMPVTAHAFRDLLPATVALVDRFERSAWLSECEDAYSFVPNLLDRAVLGATAADLKEFLSPLLRRLDRMTMAASVECRVPYLDHRLVHAVINMPLAYRVGARADKWVLRQVAAQHIPESLARRKKFGFPLPLEEYVAPLAKPEFFADGFCQQQLGLNSRGMRRLIGSWRGQVLAFFGLLTLEIWGRSYFRKESFESVIERMDRLESGQPAGV